MHPISPFGPCGVHRRTSGGCQVDYRAAHALSVTFRYRCGYLLGPQTQDHTKHEREYVCMHVPVPYPLEQVNCRISGWHISKFLIAFRPHHTRYQRYRRGRSTMPFGLEFLVINPGGGARRSRRALIKDGLGSSWRADKT